MHMYRHNYSYNTITVLSSITMIQFYSYNHHESLKPNPVKIKLYSIDERNVPEYLQNMAITFVWL